MHTLLAQIEEEQKNLLQKNIWILINHIFSTNLF